MRNGGNSACGQIGSIATSAVGISERRLQHSCQLAGIEATLGGQIVIVALAPVQLILLAAPLLLRLGCNRVECKCVWELGPGPNGGSTYR